MPVVPFVAIEIPVEIAPDLVSTALRTCNLALGSGRCALADVPQSPSNASWLAHIGMDALQPNLVHIELRDALSRSRRTTYTRSLNFEDSDAPEHRWSTAGVVVAALVISAESGRRSEPWTDTTPAVENIDGAPVTAKPSNKTDGASSVAYRPNSAESHGPASMHGGTRAFRLDLGGVTGPGVEGHAARYGMALRPSVELSRNVMLWGQIGGSRAKGAISVFWWSGSVGVGLLTEIVPGWLALEARIAAVGNRLEFEATDAAGDSDSAVRWRYGAGAGLDAALAWGDSFGFFVGVDGVLVNPRVKIRQSGNDVGQSPTTEAFAIAGLRWRIPLGR